MKEGKEDKWKEGWMEPIMQIDKRGVDRGGREAMAAAGGNGGGKRRHYTSEK